MSMQEGSLNRQGCGVGLVESTASPTTSCVLLLLLLLLLPPSWGWVRAWNMMDMASYALQVCGVVCGSHQEGVHVRSSWVSCSNAAPFPCDMPTLKHPETHACPSDCCVVWCVSGVCRWPSSCCTYNAPGLMKAGSLSW